MNNIHKSKISLNKYNINIKYNKYDNDFLLKNSEAIIMIDINNLIVLNKNKIINIKNLNKMEIKNG